MKARKTFRQWAEQWPQESRWILWIWSVFLLAILVGGVTALRNWNRDRNRDRIAAASISVRATPRLMATERPAWAARAQRVEQEFPADPELWVIAARLLRPLDARAAAQLLLDAEILRPGAAGVAAKFMPSSPLPGSREETAFARSSADSVQGALDYSGWLMVQGRWHDAQSWLAALPAGMISHPELVSRQTTLRSALRQFDELKQALAAGAWGKIDADTIELTFAARQAAQREQSALARDLWRVALVSAGDHREGQAALLRLAVNLGLREQARQSFERLLALTGNDRVTAAQFAVWAHRQENAVLWMRALQIWQEIEPAAAAAYLAAITGAPDPRTP